MGGGLGFAINALSVLFIVFFDIMFCFRKWAFNSVTILPVHRVSMNTQFTLLRKL